MRPAGGGGGGERVAGGGRAMMSFITTHTRKAPASDPRCLQSERGDFTTRVCDLFIKIFILVHK